MTELLWIGGIWFAGAVLVGATALTTGGEHPRMTAEERGWFVFNCAIWPMWVVIIVVAEVALCVRRYS